MRFEKLNNTRDLGGLPVAGGREVRYGKLVRSGRLSVASVNDVALLERMGVNKIVDFRSAEECTEKPDPALKNAVHLNTPAVKDMAAGITRDSRSDGKVIEAIIYEGMKDPDFAVKYMCSMYEGFVTSEYTRAQYARFLREVAYNSEGVTLWHCNSGKDRAGVASVILEELLGVEKEAIVADYLATNDNIAQEVDELVERVVPADAPDYAAKAVRVLFSADEKFLGALYAKAEELYGSFDNFLTEGLGADEKLRRRLRTLFLTPVSRRRGA